MLTKQIPSYLFQEYADDPSCQAFVKAFNEAAQQFLDNINALNLPIYPLQSGALLDWVGNGIYNFPRPTLQNSLVNDDVYQRCITWDFFKGDGKVFNIRWLKRRIMRFLNGTHGTDPGINQTYQISVEFGTPNIVYINILGGIIQFNGGAIYDQFQFNQKQFNETDVTIQHYTDTSLALVFKEAMDSGILEFPFQFVAIVNVSP